MTETNSDIHQTFHIEAKQSFAPVAIQPTQTQTIDSWKEFGNRIVIF